LPNSHASNALQWSLAPNWHRLPTLFVQIHCRPRSVLDAYRQLIARRTGRRRVKSLQCLFCPQADTFVLVLQGSPQRVQGSGVARLPQARRRAGADGLMSVLQGSDQRRHQFGKLLRRRELIFARSALGTDEVFRKVFKRRAGPDALLGKAFFRVIDPAAGVANVAFHLSNVSVDGAVASYDFGRATMGCEASASILSRALASMAGSRQVKLSHT
jgi:hypothetical protein